MSTNAFMSPIDSRNVKRSHFSMIQPSTQLYARTQFDDDNIEFFDLDDDDDDEFNDNYDDDYSPQTYNGIIPNPLLDAMDPDGVYERLGPELFSDWTFWRDMVLFCVFLGLFTKDTHLYGRFDDVIEGMEMLPDDFVRRAVEQLPADFISKGGL